MKNILIFNWKDIEHPEAGGAEKVVHELAKRLVQDGHKVTMYSMDFDGATESKDDKRNDNKGGSDAIYGVEKDGDRLRKPNETKIIDGIKVIRKIKSRFIHTFFAPLFFLKELKKQDFDIIVECANTAPYFISPFKGKASYFLFYHQLAREIWFYETSKPLSYIGFYLLEPVATLINAALSRVFRTKTVTVSESTKRELEQWGFKKENIKIIAEGITDTPLNSLNKSLPKEDQFTVLYHGSLRKMKRPVHVLQAFNKLLKTIPDAKLWISGGGDNTALKKFVDENNLTDKVTLFGRVSDREKRELMQKAHVLAFTSVKEGWGLVVTEANAMGTPAIGYDVDGIRDSIKHGDNLLCKPNVDALTRGLEKIWKMINNDQDEYQRRREFALKSAKEINFENSYTDFRTVIGV